MEKTYQFLDIEINKPIYRKLSAVQYDNNSRYILISVYSNFQPYDLTYATVKIYGIKKDKTVFFNNAKILDAVNGKFEIDLTEQCLACDGDVEIQIIILGSNKERLSSNSFILNIKKNIIDPVKVTSQDEWNILTEGLASLAEYDIYKNNVAIHDKKINILDTKLKHVISQVPTSKDSDSLQSAIDSIDGGILALGVGEYLITSQVKVHNNLTMRGIKGKTIITSDKRLSDNILQDTAFANDKLTNIDTLIFEDLIINGGVDDSGLYPMGRDGKKILKNTFRRGIDIDATNCKVKNIVIKNCVFSNLEDFPVLLTNINNVLIENCYFYNCIDVGLIKCENIIFTNNIIEKSADNGVSISRFCKKAIVNNNIARDCAVAGIWLSGWSNDKTGEMGLGVNEFSCMGNIIENCGHFGIQLTDAPKNGVVSGNTISKILRGAIDEPNDYRGVGIKISSYPEIKYTIADIEHYAENIVVSNNNIYNCYRGGIEARGIKHCSISSNLIRDCGSKFLVDGTTSIPDTTIEQNFGIKLGISNQFVNIKDNKIIDSRSDTFGKYPIVFINNETNVNSYCIIKDNITFGYKHKLTSLLQQDINNTNILENLIYAIQNNSHNSYISADTDGYKRLGLAKINGQLPCIIVGNSTQFKIMKSSTTNIDDTNATFSEISHIDNNGNLQLGGSINMQADGSWGNGKHIVIGNYHIWIDTNDRLRLKKGQPTSELDGICVGTQE